MNDNPLPAAPAALAPDAPDLPAFVRKRVDYFPQLLARLAHAPVWDAHEILDEALALYKAGEEDLMQGLKFIHRLTHYLAATPPAAEMRERIESWAFWTKRKEERLLSDRMEPEGKEVITEADRATLEGRLRVFKGRSNSLEYKRDIDLIEKRLAELDAPRPPHAPTPPASSPAPEAPASAPFTPLLLNYTLAELTALLEKLGLFDTATGRPTPAASPGAWVGVIHGLLEEPRPRLKGSKAAIWRAFSSTFGAVGSERAVQNGLGTRGSTAEQFKDRTLALLKE